MALAAPLPARTVAEAGFRPALESQKPRLSDLPTAKKVEENEVNPVLLILDPALLLPHPGTSSGI